MSCPGSGTGPQNCETRGNLHLTRASWCPRSQSSMWLLRKKFNSSEDLSKSTIHISCAYCTNDNFKHLAKSLAPGSDPKTCSPILFCCNSRICELLLSNWEEKNKRKPLLQKTEIHLNQSQTLQISKVIRTGHDWSVTYRGRQKPHVSLGSEVAGSGLTAKKIKGSRDHKFSFLTRFEPF